MEQIQKELKKRLTSERYAHVLRVTELAQRLAVTFQVSEADAIQAALFHDIAKCMDRESLRQLLIDRGDPDGFLSFHPELWHAPVGAIIAKEEFGVTNEDVLHAVRYHTTGRAQMSPLEQVLYVADLLEPGRDFPGVDRLRDALHHSLTYTMQQSIFHMVDYLLTKRVPIHPHTIDCYNEHVLISFENTK